MLSCMSLGVSGRNQLVARRFGRGSRARSGTTGGWDGILTDDAKCVLHAFRDGRRFSIGMTERAVASDPRRTQVALEQLTLLGYIKQVHVGAAQLYSLTVTGCDFGRHLADAASVHTIRSHRASGKDLILT